MLAALFFTGKTRLDYWSVFMNERVRIRMPHSTPSSPNYINQLHDFKLKKNVIVLHTLVIWFFFNILKHKKLM